MIGLDKKTECANVFIVLADLYKQPTRDIWDEIQQQDLLKKLEEAVNELFNIDIFIVEVLPENYEEFRELYMGSIGSTQKKAALPIECLYKQWTLDDTCTLPFARDKGYILGDSALHINYLLDKLKIEIPVELQGMPDHLAILLELLAYFIENAPEHTAAEFLDDHFDWLDEFESQLADVTAHPFYQRLTKALVEIVNAQRNSCLKSFKS
ncbi:molecular chaperone TorD family protein [Mesobacillus subterraneus]|uniref:TorD/DmsD family molecular chaperone n=1 Tax=Mesobacillus subterraneus TaxID=285983 RepID=UPI001CFC5F4A|nr:molecular chaperone TorD family protein [Mesobacillus subterraneus]WLR57584.1 molecular chaperone TorD family protein [Mesobacillus subterraneus]